MVNNPVSTMGAMPAVGLGKGGVGESSTSQVLGKREEGEGKGEGEGEGEKKDGLGGDKKRRRIAPTLVTDQVGGGVIG